MDFFNGGDEDPFDKIVREFFGEEPSRLGRQGRHDKVISGERDERIIDFIEDEKNVYVIFELPGYDKKDVNVEVKGGKIEISAKKDSQGSAQQVQGYLANKLRQGLQIKKELPRIVKEKKYDYTLKNGILEIKFEKK